jgi:DNA (cytosine-5)-methyltransferase 1
MKLLDCFCGMGGVSDGFALEGFDVTGIDIVDAPKMLGYKHRFIQADMLMLKGEDFRGYDVVWGSPPCRDFSTIGRLYGKRWKNPPNPKKGIEMINCFLQFVKDAKPTFWVLENVATAEKYLNLKPIVKTKLQRGKEHCFWGIFPPFLIPKTNKLMWGYPKKSRQNPINPTTQQRTRVLSSWLNAKIPLTCSKAFAKACKDALMEEVRV